MSAAVRVTTTTPSSRATCGHPGCPWLRVDPDDVAGAALAHAGATGHHVTVTEQRTTRYRPTPTKDQP